MNKPKDLQPSQQQPNPESDTQALKRKKNEEYLALREAILKDATVSNVALAEKRREQRAEQKKALKAAQKELSEVVTQFSSEFG